MNDLIPEKNDPEVWAGAAAVGRLRKIFKGALPDDITIARAVLASAAKVRREADTVTPGKPDPEGM